MRALGKSYSFKLTFANARSVPVWLVIRPKLPTTPSRQRQALFRVLHYSGVGRRRDCPPMNQSSATNAISSSIFPSGPINSKGTFSIWERNGIVIAVNRANSAAMTAQSRQFLR